MKSFDEFFSENFEDGLSSPSKYILKFTFEAGQKSKQDGVDKIKSDNQLSESQLGQACVKWKEIAEKRKDEVDELKKRIDKAIKLLEYNEYVDSPLQALDILKGDQS